MINPLELIDYASMSPLLIVFIAALLLILLESFTKTAAKKYSFALTAITLVFAIIAALKAPVSHNSLLTPWLAFDSFARFFTLFFLVTGLASTLLSASFFKRFKATHGEYYFLLLSAIFGLLLIGEAADFLTLFIGIETLSISLYVLCGYMKGWQISNEASIKYFLIGAIATAFLVYGIALIYGAVGTTNLAALLPSYQSLTGSNQTLFLSGIALVTLGLAFKAAVVPFHIWAPDVYDGSPTPITAFMAVGTKAGAFAAFARVFLIALPQFDVIWSQGMAWLAAITLIYANIVAMRQTQLRRFFAYSGIAQAGFLLIPLVAGTADAIPALLFYLVVYACATLGAFAILTLLDHREEGVMLHDLQGLFLRSPLLAGIFTLCLLTLAGIPPTAGFFAKFYVFKLAFQTGHYLLVIVGLLTTIFSAFYYLRFVSVMLSRDNEKPLLLVHEWGVTVVGVTSFLFILILSIYPHPLMQWLIID